MLNNLTGEVSINWDNKQTTKPLSTAVIQAGVSIAAAVIFTAIIGFTLFGLSPFAALLMAVVSLAGLGAGAYFLKSNIISFIFGNAENNNSANNQEAAPSVEADANAAISAPEAEELPAKEKAQA